MKKAFSFFLITFSLANFSQELPSVTPLSPNAASIAKYGEIPVGRFTGVPNISIPIFTLESGPLALPLSLSYHAGGNKVESIASWVGLGWSLGEIPSISRSVRGLPDENGFYTKYNGQYSVAQIAGHSEDPVTFSENFMNTYQNALYNGNTDSEPDIFSYSIPGESGKFFWDQETDSFITYPKSNIKIIRDGLNFTLISQEGNEYIFNRHDQTKTDTHVEGSFVTNSWYATKMTSASKKDSIRFTYLQENQLTKTVGVTIKYHYLGGVTGNGYPTADGSILGNTLTYAMLPDSIISSNGYIKFNKSMNSREDLNGGKSLENISIYNNENKLITKYNFKYHFKTGNGSGGGTVCANIDDYTKKWMLLNELEQVSNDSSEKLIHSFLYNESYFPACRISAAQDYWGFYNGFDSNQNLIPSYYVHGTSNLVSGADRSVNASKSDYGILEKIIYPTGGYTEFEYENNQALNADLPPQYIKVNQGLYGDDYYDENGNFPSNLRDFESSEFTINHPTGVSQIKFTIQLPGCDISNGANTCALFTMTNVATNEKWFPHLDGTISNASNGTYKLNASFDTTNNNYQDFIFIVEWDELAPNQSNNKFVGGIRVKEIRNYTNNNAQPIIKKYKYTAGFNSTESSGDIFGDPNFSHSNVISYYNNPPQGGVTYTSLQKISSISNKQQVSHSGSFVGYKKVFEESIDTNETGYTEFEFSHEMDQGGEGFPYPPSLSKEIYRGLLLKESHYKRINNDSVIVRVRSLEYTSDPFDSDVSTPKFSSGIKWENTDIGCLDCNEAQNLTPYFVVGGWNNLSEESIKDYYGDDFSEKITNYFYDNQNHLLKTRTETMDSDGNLLISKVKYPQDISNSSTAISELITQNRLGEIIETENYKDLDNDGIADTNELLSKLKNEHKVWGANLILPEFIQTSKGSDALENRVIYHAYDDKGNPLEVSKADGTRIVYIWGYQQQFPIAKIENTTYTEVINQEANLQSLSNADDDSTFGLVGNEGALRFALNNLRDTLANSLVTTYTYDPLIGVTSITDPRGYTTYYEYDEFNRLKTVKDANNNIISQNEYHYKDQQE